GGTDNGITVTGDNALIKDVWVKSATGHGIAVSSSARTRIDTCAIEDCTLNGINIGASTTLSTIHRCILAGNADGADLEGASVTDNVFENNLIYNNSGYGIDIDAAVDRTAIRLHHTLAQNTSGNINDESATTIYDTAGAVGPGDIADIADAVWDELIAGHVATGSTGKTLKDTKVKATLASLK
ncbi:MAG: right-handed parallel beta-helix repeat-containing protein, partial [Patescibacteria group bacterium]